VIPVLPVVDTLKQVEAGRVVDTPDRSVLRAVQTPQGFRAATLLKAHRLALDNGTAGITDDAGLVEAMGGPVHVIPGHDDAFKITRPTDQRLAEAVFAARASGVQPEEL
jgi:2-C-methyl-D-erythritol 4-phosphate cytidylyltransferase